MDPTPNCILIASCVHIGKISVDQFVLLTTFTSVRLTSLRKSIFQMGRLGIRAFRIFIIWTSGTIFSCSLSPNILQDETKVRIQWEMYLRDDFPIPGFECSKMFGWAPVPYNQTCHSASEKLRTKSSINYCSPNCIAGCGPVAWMVLANAFRGFDYSRFPLLSDASDWHVPWGVWWSA